MREITLYLIQVAAASGIFYVYYHFALRNKKFHKYNRFYLLAAAVISLVIPFLNIPLYFTETQQQSSALLQTLAVVSGSEYEQEVIVQAGTRTKQSLFTQNNILFLLYILTAMVALTRVFLSLRKIRKIAKNNPSEKIENIHFVNTDEPGTPFSFFRWLFWNRKIELNSAKGKHVFRHELFHIEQKHSFDIIFLELLTVVFWINPFFHLIKKEVKAIHEFLADQFAIHEENKWEYAELLLQQALDTKLSLVNPFFHNQIKRRIAMITNSKKPGYQYIRKLMALPVAAIAVGLFAFTYKSAKPNTDYYSGKQVTVVIDAGHGGNDAGAKAADGTTEKDLTLAIAKKVKELNTNENIRIVMTREDDSYPSLQSRSELAVKKNTDLYLAIHVNSTYPKSQTNPGGFEVYISKKNNSFENQNKTLASILLNNCKQFYETDISIKKRNVGIWVLDAAPCPSALLICGYMSNEKDLAFIKKEQNQEKIAQAILNGINNYLQFEIPLNSEKNELKAENDIVDTLPKKITPNNGNKVYDKVEIEATFPGGDAKWRQYLERSLNANVPIDNKAPNGTYTTITEFIVGLDGSITNMRPLTKHGYGMEEEAIRVIAKGPKWLPAIVNGKNVQSYRKQPVTFQVSGVGSKKTDNSVAITKDMLNEVVVTGFQKESDNRLFEKIEEPAQFPGGSEAWRNYLAKNLNANVPIDSGAAPGTYKVEMQFIVNTDGSISDIKPLTQHGYGMEKEVVSLLKKSPKWIPAKQNGHIVKSYNKIPVTFQITEESDNETSKITITELKTISIYKLLGIEDGTKIVSFSFGIDLENNEIVIIPNKGNQLHPAIKNYLNTTKPGRLITFDDIFIMQNGAEKKVASKAYKVVS